jgi:hypothetical protein
VADAKPPKLQDRQRIALPRVRVVSRVNIKPSV